MPNEEKTPAKVRRGLDQWAQGFLCGVVFGLLFSIGMLAAIMEPLK